jgi:hypothetical protein
MAARGIGSKGLWRRLVSWVAVYALVLQSILVGMAGVRAAAAPDGIAGFELCQHSPDGGGTDTGIPGPHSLDHCKFCLSIAHAVAPAPRALPRVTFRVVLTLAQPAHDSDIPAPPALFYEPPRGPPIAA